MLKLSFERILFILLIFIPISIVMELTHSNPVFIFFTAALAIIPLAGFMGKATEELSKQVGAGLGGLLNATFGNATELIIAIFALQAGLFEVVKASITGGIIGNMLLIVGCSMLFGGLKREKQTFNPQVQGANSTMLALAAVGLIMPALVSHIFDFNTVETLSLGVSFILVITYIFSLLFSLRTHKHLYSCEEDPEECKPKWSKNKAIMVLLLTTAVIAMESEFLVGAVEPVSASLGLTELFIGVIVVAIIGNAAEHSTAILMAIKNKMDLSLGIAIGSSTQIALLIAPVLVFVSYIWGNPMTLVFNQFEVVAIIAAVVIANMICSDGESNWFEGVQLIALYAMMGVVFFLI
ncbi:calcium/proton exchanger [Methanocella sp. CWC-04]|uniref:Calcium/proton exchanger n=1 Tax=Methanooceanicella nereidis TaxID=2052831 RepID=A0AAP2W5A4_9EURY|nr:calcium/proton exchanger [Methanocella sp. CWC-04]MCD1294118.1 calcium/proton exchanger [Methanocella sp. CWC-04]